MHHSYIVRISRHRKDNSRMIVGTVEKVGGQGKLAFTNIDELWEIVKAPASEKNSVFGPEEKRSMTQTDNQGQVRRDILNRQGDDRETLL